ncbi:hypothetical protein OG819_00035 [Streptomyces sp. NBC_01549]|uniref:ADP-ribosyltransferase n=1 Tax=Streptomyces sp. NBC_01549 TaxID=2975874 RepID=UPI002254DCBF|nr:ADP-ribosyltransferase [Streptomyces sp. NBC_01549]MCX4588195.1 hypothetical protein [Streptomyces sp. NBC_01549]
MASGTGVRVAGDAELSAARGSLSELRLVDKHYRTDQPNAVVGRPTVRAGGGLPITKPKHEELGLIERWMRDVFGSDVEGWPDYGRLRRGTLAIDRMRRAEQGIQHRFSTALIDILLKDQEGDNSFALTSPESRKAALFRLTDRAHLHVAEHPNSTLGEFRDWLLLRRERFLAVPARGPRMQGGENLAEGTEAAVTDAQPPDGGAVREYPRIVPEGASALSGRDRRRDDFIDWNKLVDQDGVSSRPPVRIFTRRQDAHNWGKLHTPSVAHLDMQAREAISSYINYGGQRFRLPFKPGYGDINQSLRGLLEKWLNETHYTEISPKKIYDVYVSEENESAPPAEQFAVRKEQMSGEEYLRRVLESTDENIAALDRAFSRPGKTGLEPAYTREPIVVTRNVHGGFTPEEIPKLPGRVLREAGFMSTTLDPITSFHGRFRLHLFLPKGTTALYISDKESELLLPRDTLWQVLHVEFDGDWRWNIFGRVLL